MSPAGELSAVIAQLRDHLAYRRMEAGMRTLESHRPLLYTVEPAQRNAGVLVGLVAQWVDIGFADPELVRELLERFPKPSRASMPLLDYVHIRMAEGLSAMAEEEFERAIRHFQFVESMEGEIA